MATSRTMKIETTKRTNTSLRGYSWCAAPVAAVVVVMLLATGCSSQDPPRQYSEEELAFDGYVDEFMRGAVPYSRYRTRDERTDPPLDDPGGIGHERERNFLEATLRLIMHFASDTLPPDVALTTGVLHDAENEAMDECAAEAGWPDVQLYDVSNDVVQQYERDLGLTLEMFFDLRHECSKYAITYPTLDPAYRDELLAKRRVHYMKAVRDWIAANPERVVPVEHHDGDNHHYEELWVRFCQQEEDPQQCARQKQVTLP